MALALPFGGTNSYLASVCTDSLRALQGEVEEHVLNAWHLVPADVQTQTQRFALQSEGRCRCIFKVAEPSSGNILAAHCERMHQ